MRTIAVTFDRRAAAVIRRHRADHPALSCLPSFEAASDAFPVAEALRAAGHRVSLVGLDGSAVQDLAALGAAKPDVVFNLCDTLCGDGASALLVPAALEVMGIPFTGTDAAGLALSKRKHDVKHALAQAGVPTPRYQVVSDSRALDGFQLALEPPVIVKPTGEHASIGVELESVCFTSEEVRARASALIARLRGSVLVEEYVDGPEVYVSVAGCPERPLGLMEYGFDDVPPGFPRIRTFDYKWFGLMEAETVQDPRWREPVPARYAVTPFAGTLEDIERICVHAFQLGGGRDWGRVDVRIDARTDTPFVIDVTPNTYLGASSPCAKAALAAGLPYPALVESIVNGALGRERR